MIRSNLPKIMANHKDRNLSALARRTGLNRTAITALYNDNWRDVRRETINALCKEYGCTPGDLFEYIPEGLDSTDNEK